METPNISFNCVAELPSSAVKIGSPGSFVTPKFKDEIEVGPHPEKAVPFPVDQAPHCPFS